MDNLYAFGLVQKEHLDIIFVNIHPVYLTSIRSTCKLFQDRVDAIIPHLYQKWVVNLPLHTIRKDTEKWKFKELVVCSLNMFPVPESRKLKRKDRVLVNALLNGYSEEECLQYIGDENIGISYSGEFHIVTEILFLAYKYDYKQLINEVKGKGFDIYRKLFSSLFQETNFERDDEEADISETIEQLLDHPHVSLDTYLSLLKICLSVEPGPHTDFILGLEAETFDEEEGNAYYPIGYFLALHVERTKLTSFLSSLGITANIPGNKTFHQFYNNHTIDSYTDLNSVTNIHGYAICVAIYRPHKYVELLRGNNIVNELINVFDRLVIHPYYSRVRNL